MDGFVVVTCGSCGNKLKAPVSAQGRTARCAKCGARLRIEIPETPVPAEADEAVLTSISIEPTETTTAARTIAPEAAPVALTSTPEVAPPAPKGRAIKAVILTAAVMFLGIVAWGAADRVGGRAYGVVKFSVVAWLIGMGTASAVMAGSGRSGVGAKGAAALAAMLTIVLGKFLVAMMADGAPPISLEALKNLFGPVDPLIFAMAVAGSGFRFLLARPDV